MNMRNIALFAAVGALFIATGLLQSWNLSFAILQMALISAIMALGLNIQWGYAGLFNTGIMGFAALGGLAVVLVASPPVPAGWQAGGLGILISLLIGALTVVAAVISYRKLPKGWMRALGTAAVLAVGYALFRVLLDPNVAAVEAINPSQAGHIGGLGLQCCWRGPQARCWRRRRLG